MAVWRDPLRSPIAIPPDLDKQWFQLGSKKFQLLAHQYELLASKEELIVMMGGYGCAKTDGGVKKIAHLAMFPGNRILVGRNAATDLEETTQRDLCDFLHEAELMKVPPNSKTKKAIVYCVDPVTQKNLGYTSEISFQHLDDPNHLRGRHLGVYWIDEASEVKKEAHKNLAGRLRLPAFAGRYQAIITGNPQGRNWCFDLGFNEEEIVKKLCPVKKHFHATTEDSNVCVRKRYRAIHARSIDNYFLPDSYIENMLNSYSPAERKRYMDGEFDVFEGAVFGEFDPEIHILGEAA
jgi:PBSX family phage terminase large subunit